MPGRIPGRNFLFVPGPTNVPDRVQRAMVVAMEDHRSSKFPDLSTSVLQDLKRVFKTSTGPVKMSREEQFYESHSTGSIQG